MVGLPFALLCKKKQTVLVRLSNLLYATLVKPNTTLTQVTRNIKPNREFLRYTRKVEKLNSIASFEKGNKGNVY